ncbi:MAG: flagellar hook-basal body complex protein [Planctomycetaceae bacterium]
MANSLLTGISGLRGHQKMLEVVGNNLANLNTTAFKSSRALFSDLMYEVQRGSSSSSTGLLGSVNAVQIGTGSRLSQVDLNFAQGNLEATGNDLDMAIDGGGFFVATSAERVYFTRAGAFSLDESGYLSDPSTGYLVQRFGTVGEANGDLPSFQQAGDNRIYVPKGTNIPGLITSTLNVKGNLSSLSTGPVSQELTTSAPLTVGGNPAALTTLLNELDTNTVDYTGTDRLMISGRKPDGSLPDLTDMNVDETTTVQDLINRLNAAFGGATVSLDSFGNIVATDNNTGPSFLNITFTDGPTNTGRSDWENVEMIETDKGKDADTVYQAVEVFDESGAAHSIGLTFTKQANGSWNMVADVSPIDGVMLDAEVQGVSFSANGSFAQVTGTGVGDINITVQFDGQPSPQNVELYFGEPGKFDGLTQLGIASSLELSPDGYPPGELAEVQMDTDGTLFGLATNGLSIPLAQLAIASFRNVDGLVSVGANYYEASLASGNPEFGTALTGNRGSVRSGQLEGSNVDLALEFTRLIIAQRGFSANARTITVTDEVLQELTTIIR